ncbi:hypothetical protein ACQEVC_06385 [Plantactinospora sp. CA-294935]
MEEPAERLERRLGGPDAVVIGLGPILGARVFVVFGRRLRSPAAGSAY